MRCDRGLIFRVPSTCRRRDVESQRHNVTKREKLQIFIKFPSVRKPPLNEVLTPFALLELASRAIPPLPLLSRVLKTDNQKKILITERETEKYAKNKKNTQNYSTEKKDIKKLGLPPK